MIAKGGVEDTTFEAKDTKKYEVKDRLLKNRPFRGQKKMLEATAMDQRYKAQVFSKKIIIR